MSQKREFDDDVHGNTKRIKGEANAQESGEKLVIDADAVCDDGEQMKDEIMKQKPDERCMIHLADDVYVVAKYYNNQLQVHIRQYTRYGEEIYPSKKGVVLTLARWRLLETYAENVDKYFEDYHGGNLTEEEDCMHLGGGTYITLNNKYPVVNIRHWWKPDDTTDPCPTKRGIILNKFKWNQLKAVMLVIRDFVPELNESSVGCEEDHQNQIGMLRCKECHPFNCEVY